MHLLSVNQDAKTVRGFDYGYLTGILYLAPGDHSGYECCKSRTPGCFSSCLFTAGRSAAYPKINQARIRKTKLFFEQRDKFFDLLCKDIESLQRKADKLGVKPCVRLNGTSDIRYEDFPIGKYSCIMEKYPDVQFYDYTKHDVILRTTKISQLGITNYELVFSRAETKLSHKRAEAALSGGHRVSAVFRGDLPKTYMGRPVVKGDTHDLIFRWPQGSVLGLSAKGKGRSDNTGFVI